MRNILACIAAGVLILAGVGWYLGWFHVQTTPTPDGHREVKIDVDSNKIKADVNKGEQNIENLIHQQNSGKPPEALTRPLPAVVFELGGCGDVA